MQFLKGRIRVLPPPSRYRFHIDPCPLHIAVHTFHIAEIRDFQQYGGKKAKKRQQCFPQEPGNLSACFLLICANCGSHIAVFFP